MESAPWPAIDTGVPRQRGTPPHRRMSRDSGSFVSAILWFRCLRSVKTLPLVGPTQVSPTRSPRVSVISDFPCPSFCGCLIPCLARHVLVYYKRPSLTRGPLASSAGLRSPTRRSKLAGAVAFAGLLSFAILGAVVWKATDHDQQDPARAAQTEPSPAPIDSKPTAPKESAPAAAAENPPAVEPSRQPPVRAAETPKPETAGNEPASASPAETPKPETARNEPVPANPANSAEMPKPETARNEPAPANSAASADIMPPTDTKLSTDTKPSTDPKISVAVPDVAAPVVPPVQTAAPASLPAAPQPPVAALAEPRPAPHPAPRISAPEAGPPAHRAQAPVRQQPPARPRSRFASDSERGEHQAKPQTGAARPVRRGDTDTTGGIASPAPEPSAPAQGFTLPESLRPSGR